MYRAQLWMLSLWFCFSCAETKNVLHSGASAACKDVCNSNKQICYSKAAQDTSGDKSGLGRDAAQKGCDAIYNGCVHKCG